MRNNIQQIINKIKKTSKKRTISLAIFLSLLIVMPLVLSSPQEKQNTKQHAQTVPQGVFPIFGTNATNLDTLNPGWTAKITYGGASSTYDMFSKAPVYCGTNAVSWTITSSSFEQLELISPTAFDITPYTYLTFYAQAGSPGQSIGALLIDASGNPIPSANAIPIDQYGGVPAVGTWTAYNVPISAFNATNKTITGIALKDLNGGTQNIQPPPPIFFDEINFSSLQGSSIACPTTSTGSPSAQTSVSPSSNQIEDPYSPQISPWVFIIPGIILGLAIIFQ